MLSLIGFGISYYLFDARTMKHNHSLCPHGADCAKVITSPYARLWYVHNTVWGMMGFVVLFCSATLAGVTTGALQDGLYVLLLITAVLAAIVALLLTLIQLFVIRRFCAWCLIANIIAICIFALLLV